MINRLMNLRKILAGIVLFLLSFHASAQEKKFQVAIIAFYNTENLFDTVNDPLIIDEEYLPGGAASWNTQKYITKIARISEVISRVGEDVVPGGPVVIGLSEIENRQVLEDLTNSDNLKTKQYGVVHFNSPDRRGVDVGLLYQKNRFVVEGSKPFRLITPDTAFRTRDQLLVWGKLDGDPIWFLVNHWPSRRGGEGRSAPKRKAAAELSKHIADSLMAMDPQVKLVIMGDLNDNPTNNSLTKIMKTKTSPDNTFKGELYNPMYKLYQEGIGSYAYRDSWDLIDQLIVSYGLANISDYQTYKFAQAKVFNQQFLKQKTGTFTGYPWRTSAGGQYLGGYSDHFPVYLILKRDIR